MKRLQEMPTHPDLDEKEPWKSAAFSLKMRRRALEAQTREALHATAVARDRILRGKSYVGPLRREQAFIAQMRSVRSGASVRSGLGATQTLEAAARPVGQSDLTLGLELGSELAHGHPLRSALLPSAQGRHPAKATGARTVLSFSHNGSFGLASTADPGAGYQWSCCGSGDRGSRGCIMSTRNPERHIYDSPFGR